MTANNIEARVRKFIADNHLLKRGDRVTAGVSGGADSMCLLFLLMKLQPEYGLKLSVVHVEHGIRGEESRSDAAFVKNFCEEHGIPVKIIEIDAAALARADGMSVEEAGRAARYKAFLEEENDRIAVAHHRNDLAETMLFNLFRGSGIRGMASIAPVNGKIIRPLLILDRAEIEQYDAEMGIDYRIDCTNRDNHYARNSIRNEIIPKAELINDRAVDHICETAAVMREADEFLTEQAAVYYDRYVSGGSGTLKLDMTIFDAAAPLMARYVIRRMIGELAGKLKDVTHVHVAAIMSLSGMESGRHVDIAYGITATREFDSILMTIKNEQDNVRSEVCLVPGERISLEQNCVVISALITEKMTDIPNLPYTKWFDYGKIKNTVVFRTRRAGDMVSIKGGSKKLRSVMIDDRVPVHERDSMYLLADGSSIIWIPGCRIGEEYKVTETTEKILMVKMELQNE